MLFGVRMKPSIQLSESDPVRKMREAMESLEKVIQDTRANRRKAQQIAADASELATNLGGG